MPGIYGICSPNINDAHAKSMEHMVGLLSREHELKIDKLESRGVFCGGKIHLGIFNNDSWASSEDGQITAGYHGEIYLPENVTFESCNFVPKALIERYRKHGIEGVEDLEGSYVLLILDRQKHRLIISADRFGSKPVYYTIAGNSLCLASEVKALLASSVDRVLDLRSIFDFFAFGFVLGDRTLFSDIKLLRYASTLTYDWIDSRLEIKRYWDFNYSDELPCKDAESYVPDFEYVLENAIRKCTKVKVKTGLLLSGGLDTRGILAFLLKSSFDPKDIIAFNWGEGDCPDMAIPRLLSETYGFRLKQYRKCAHEVVNNFDEIVWITDGMADNAILSYPSGTAILKDVRGHVDCVLHGREVFGWGKSKANTMDEAFNQGLPMAFAKQVITMSPWIEDYKRRFSECWDELNGELTVLASKFKRLNNISDYLFASERVCKRFLTGDAVRNGVIETRTPYYNKEVVDFIIALPMEFRIDKNLFRLTMKRLFPGLFLFPNASASGHVDWLSAQRSHEQTKQFFHERFANSNVAQTYMSKHYIKKIVKAIKAPPSDVDGPEFNKWQRSWRLCIRTVVLDSWFRQISSKLKIHAIP